MSHKINHANIKEWAKNYDGELFDGILCDPPYELGFMGKSWDSSGIAFDQEMWADIFKLLKPGGHLLAFSGSRTYHRMAVAIEDAGFEIRDMIEWVYGSGFPKSLNIGKSVEALVTTGNASKNGFHKLDGERRDGRIGMYDTVEEQGFRAKNPDQLGAYDLEPKTDEAKIWNGYGTALKPAHEPCVLARKPIEGTVANNVLKHGTGGLNIDGTRIQTTENLNGGGYNTNGTSVKDLADATSFATKVMDKEFVQPTGRFPANLIHDGSDEVEAVFPNDNQRFFYCSKASKSERNAGLDGFEEQITNYGRKTDIDNAFQRGITERKNHHPTVKPLSLTKYLATLIKPPTGGRLLVPFSGSGSEMIGALQAGWEYVEGVELTEEYIPIAEARIKYWLKEKEAESKQLALV
jgi:DNA modification methylase